jgi:cytochrome c553
VKRILVLIVSVVLCGCGDQSESPAEMSPKLKSEAPVRDRPTEVEMVASMEAHYSVVILAHDALLHGDLEAFRSQLALAAEQELPPSSPEAWLPLHERLQAAASGGSHAANLDTAANALAALVLACGGCHAALGRGPIYPAPSPDEGDNPIATAMRDHVWATERLWEGVTGPWDNAWQRGADALAMTRLFGDQGEQLVVTDDLQRRQQELREIGQEAKSVSALDERAALYGRLLATCGECHRAIGVSFDEP